MVMILWQQLAEINKAPPQVQPLQQTEHARPGGAFAVLIPVNASVDPAVRRNADLLKERFEAGMAFSSVVVEDNVTSESQPSADDPENSVTVSSALMHAFDAIAPSVRANALDIVVLYVCSTSPLDPNHIVSTLQRYPSVVSRTCLIFDSPALSPFSAHAVSAASGQRGQAVIPPVLSLREGFGGHLAMKLLHAILDLGDGGRLPSLATVAALISDVSQLANGHTPLATTPWSTRPLVSNAKATVIVCGSQLVTRDDETNEIVAPDGRAVGSNVKRVISAAKVRLVVEKQQAFVLAFPPERQFVITLDEAHDSFDQACSKLGINTPSVNFATLDLRVHATLPPEEFPALAESMLNGSLTLPDPAVPSATLRWQYFATSYKFELVTTYREFLLLDALARLRAPSPGDAARQVILEELGLPVVTPPSSMTDAPPAPAPGQRSIVPPEERIYPDPAAPAAAGAPSSQQQQQQQQQHETMQAQHSTISMRSAPSFQQQPEAAAAATAAPPPASSGAAAAAPQPPPAATPPPPPAAGAGLSLADVDKLIESRITAALEKERTSRDGEIKQLREEHEKTVGGLRDEIVADRAKHEKAQEALVRDIAETRKAAADHVAVEKVIAALERDIDHLRQRATDGDSSTVASAASQRTELVELRRHFEAGDVQSKQVREDVNALGDALQQLERSLSNIQGQVVGLEKRQEGMYRELTEVRENASAATAIASNQLPEVLGQATDVARRVRVVEAAIEKLHHDALVDLTAHARQLAALDGGFQELSQVAQQLGRNTDTSHLTERAVEAVAEQAANRAAAHTHADAQNQIVRVQQRLDDISRTAESAMTMARSAAQQQGAAGTTGQQLSGGQPQAPVVNVSAPAAPAPAAASADVQLAISQLNDAHVRLRNQVDELAARHNNEIAHIKAQLAHAPPAAAAGAAPAAPSSSPPPAAGDAGSHHGLTGDEVDKLRANASDGKRAWARLQELAGYEGFKKSFDRFTGEVRGELTELEDKVHTLENSVTDLHAQVGL